MARPTEFNEAIADAICERIADGESMRSICSDDAMPAKSTVFKWLSKNSEFADQYARASECRADVHADEIIDISDDPALEPNDKRVRVDARKWVASKLRPKKYGDKTLLGSDPENPLPAAVSLDASKLSTEALRELKNAVASADPANPR